MFDKKPHTLFIEDNRYEEDGEIDWYIEHTSDCTSEKIASGMFDDLEVFEEVFTCGVQHEVDNIGLEGLDGWQKLKPGEYKIVSWHTGPDYLGEYDGGLKFWDETKTA